MHLSFILHLFFILRDFMICLHPMLIHSANNKGIISIFERFGSLVQFICDEVSYFWTTERGSLPASLTVRFLLACDHVS